MNRPKRIAIVGGLLGIAAAMLLLVPLACPACSGSGKITAMKSHPEAMAEQGSTTGALIDVDCPACEGTSRESLAHRWLTSERPQP
jgi:hypothetical protein